MTTAAPRALEDLLRRARADDATLARDLEDGLDPELLGEWTVAVADVGTPAALAAACAVVARPYRRGAWQAWKRLFKRVEARLPEPALDEGVAAGDARLLGVLLAGLEDDPAGGPSLRTVAYVRRRAFRLLKALAQRAPARFRAAVAVHLAAIPPDAPRPPLAARVLRLDRLAGLEGEAGGAGAAGGTPAARTPSAGPVGAGLAQGVTGLDARATRAGPAALGAAASGAGAFDFDALLDLDDAALQGAASSPTPGAGAHATPGAGAHATPGAGAREAGDPAGAAAREAGAAPPAVPPSPPAWPGPIFVEAWLADPAWLWDLAVSAAHPDLAGPLALLLRERAGDALLALPLDRVYAGLASPSGALWRLALEQVVARARADRLRWADLAPVLDRAAGGEAAGGPAAPDWPAALLVLEALDRDEAEAEHRGLAPALAALLRAGRDDPRADAVASFVWRRLGGRLPGGDAGGLVALALDLLEGTRPAVRALGRSALAAGPGAARGLDAPALRRLLASPLAAEDPDAALALLRAPAAGPHGHVPGPRRRLPRPGEARPAWSADDVGAACDDLPEPGLACLRTALHGWADARALDPDVARVLVARPRRRARRLGLELIDAHVRAGALDAGALAGLLASPHDDVVGWAQDALARAAAAGRLPNEALYAVLDAPGPAAQAFGRALVRAHLRGFERGELVAFLVESPDAATADLGLALWEEGLAAAEGGASPGGEPPGGEAPGALAGADAPGGVPTPGAGVAGAGGARARLAHVPQPAPAGASPVRAGARAPLDLRPLLPAARCLLLRPGVARREKERLYGLLERWALAGEDEARATVDLLAAWRRTDARVDLERALPLLARIGARFPGVALPFPVRTVFGGARAGPRPAPGGG